MTTLTDSRTGEKDTRKAKRFGWRCLIEKRNPVVEVPVEESAPVKIVPKKGKK